MKELSIEKKAKRYDEAIKKVNDYYEGKIKLYSDVDKTLDYLFPELRESDDERIRKVLIDYFNRYKEQEECGVKTFYGIPTDNILAWLEKQKVTDKEIIFRPVVGTDIRIAAKQALEKIDIGKKVVLAFNGAYIPVNGKTVGEIDSEYDAWLEKQRQKETDPRYENLEELLAADNIYQMAMNDDMVQEAKTKAINALSELEIGKLLSIEKQGDTNETFNRDEFAQGVLRGAAINLITWIDYNTAKGNMCLSNMECRVIEDALVSGDWDKIYAYIKRKLEKQGESKFEQSIQEGDKIVTNDDGTHFNISQLERTAKKVTESKEAVKEFLKKAGIIDGNGELAEEYRLEKKDEQKPNPYTGTSFEYNGHTWGMCARDNVTLNSYLLYQIEEEDGLEYIKPYLRPMSSMTEEEEKEYINIDNRSYSCPMAYAHIPASERIDWLNAYHFDFMGLIPKGLAIEVTDENNPY